MKEGDTAGIIKGIGGSLTYGSSLSPSFRFRIQIHLHQRFGHCLASPVGYEMARPVCRFHRGGHRLHQHRQRNRRPPNQEWFYIQRPHVSRRKLSGPLDPRLALTKCKNNEGGKGTIQRSKKELVAEGLTAIIAGYVICLHGPNWCSSKTNRSDTTAVVLSNLWYYLLIHPVYYDRLQQEIDTTFLRGEDPIDQERLAGMEFLNACISETLRLAPPVPSGSQRGVPTTAHGKLVGSKSVFPFPPSSPYAHIYAA